VLQHEVDELGQRAGEFDSRGATSTDRERQQRRSLFTLRTLRGPLEAFQDVIAKSHGLL